MSASRDRIARPSLPDGFDDSRARERADDPTGWRFSDPERAAVWRAIAERRDIRRFRPDPLPDELLLRLLEAAHQAPSVGLMQPWRFVVVRSEETRAAMQAIALRERLRQGESFDGRAREFLALKLEGIREAPLSLCVCCDRGADDEEVLGRHTIRDADIYSTCLAIENLWLAARAEGVGVGWVSFYRAEDVQDLLGLPARVVPVAWLCVGYPDERPVRPGLEAAGWGRRLPLDELVFVERWGRSLDTRRAPARRTDGPESEPAALPEWWRRLASAVRPGDPVAALRVRDASDDLVKPTGSLGALETLAEQFGLVTGAPPPATPRAGVLVLAADHGIAARGVSLYPSSVSAQVAAAAARGETAIGVLARALGAELVVADVGLAGPRPRGVLDRRVAEGSADMSVGPALEPAMLQQAVETGYELASDLAARCDMLLVGEIGIGNTTAASALLSALTGLPATETCGRGTGIDAQMLLRKQELVATALAVNGLPAAGDPLECLRRVGGLELAALAGALLGAAAARRPVLLDGFATGVVALAAYRTVPALRDYLVAGHRSAEPAHARVLVELGLEPLLDLRLRLGEASGAALALPLVGLAGRLHAEMARFDEANVERAKGMA
ncbi:nicotinate-nucleotide--dimethylbenzimidazole phosphoribosyltransferase [Gaiella occulta]|uniref:Nicotinate-nucleotide--dimethylbenzimidazole phosphoribosyltransferase n=1 Tax=Gaiella occulta TaxID=1002870 RepID=A0A7M2YUM9_9ACTN|nr:nicotinate-nucleotide--dimethylbenzimidazole phosphoribosyltransferase [Gaiella occulta]RDI73574.1 nicotinate-nucleotide--dimethylbenzimidazole phosphoribosyltransferase [Gaiella occulta]